MQEKEQVARDMKTIIIKSKRKKLYGKGKKCMLGRKYNREGNYNLRQCYSAGVNVVKKTYCYYILLHDLRCECYAVYHGTNACSGVMLQ